MRRYLFLLATLLAVTNCQKDDDKNALDIINTINQREFSKKISKFGANRMTADKVVEGDIVLTPRLEKYLDAQRNDKKISPFDAIVNGAWPNKKVYYSTRRLPYAAKRAVGQAVAEYHAKTCIRFIDISNNPRGSYLDFFVGGGCYSMIGRQGGRQEVSLGRGCETKGVTIHEIMHALGFFHEQSRRDRDRYVRIMWQNIPRSVRYNFEKYRHGQADTLGEPYDKKSVMHYGNYAFSNNRRKTIVSIANPNEVLGQRNGLSDIDVKQLRKYYKCDPVRPSPKPSPKPTACTDKYSLCSTLARVKLCDVSVTTWVRDNCKKACGKCTTEPARKPRCKYNSRKQYCGSWKRRGMCVRGQYVRWMSENCSNCGKCSER